MEAKVKWYNKPQLVGTLLLFWPPFGWYGLYKSENIDLKFKVAVLGAHLLAIILLILVHYY